MNDRYRIVFEKLSDALSGEQLESAQVGHLESELEEIAELRRLVCEVSESEPVSYTTT
jgi:hypothetical protein